MLLFWYRSPRVWISKIFDQVQIQTLFDQNVVNM